MIAKNYFGNFIKMLYTFLFYLFIVNPHQCAYATQAIDTLEKASEAAGLISQNNANGKSKLERLVDSVLEDHSIYSNNPNKSYFLATNSEKLREILLEIIHSPTHFKLEKEGGRDRLILTKIFNKDIGFDPYLKPINGTGFTNSAVLVVDITGISSKGDIQQNGRGALITAYVGSPRF